MDSHITIFFGCRIKYSFVWEMGEGVHKEKTIFVESINFLHFVNFVWSNWFIRQHRYVSLFEFIKL